MSPVSHEFSQNSALSRRAFLIASAGTLAGCATIPPEPPRGVEKRPVSAFADMYGPLPDERFPIPAVDLEEIDERFLRRIVPNTTGERAGTIIVDTRRRHLYLAIDDGQAIRYGVGVGREGLAWSGRAIVGRKAEWPRWTPTPAMIAREPERNARWAGGMEPGLGNPLGARALYLGKTVYRIHGTNQPSTIGQFVSSGCIRLLNEDVEDLYSRVKVGTKVVVLPGSAPSASNATAIR
jgi:lipoprotein-anchoring transpeptidase ErfK/SrfK